MKNNQTYTVEEAKRALEKYCTYQERCHKEVEEKLRKMNMIPAACEEIILHLIAHRFLDETRFAQSYARGKFNIKKWGRVRITQELKRRDISSYNIKTALKEINEEAYVETLENLMQRSFETVKETHPLKKKKKICEQLYRKGYETELIFHKYEAFYSC